ncbi:MAG TPA: hypothetical protein VEC37_13025 [Bacillota bacterium]|nr:hypothetical protein [Bacillota bacterium]
MDKKHLLLLVIGCLLLTTNPIAATTRKEAPNKTTPKPPPEITTSQINDAEPYLTIDQSFDMNVKILPKNFHGHNYEIFFEELESKYAPKDEFETNAAYRNRLEKNNQLFSNFLFALPYEDYPICDYDADKQMIIFKYIKANIDTVNNIYNGNFSLSTNTIRIHNRTYMATDENGTVVEIEENTFNIYGFSIDSELKFEDIEITIPPSEAKAVKENLKILYIGKARPGRVEGLFYKTFSHNEPTMDCLLDHYYNYYLINVNLVAIWVYDYKTGKIYKKINIAQP